MSYSDLLDLLEVENSPEAMAVIGINPPAGTYALYSMDDACNAEWIVFRSIELDVAVCIVEDGDALKVWSIADAINSYDCSLYSGYAQAVAVFSDWDTALAEFKRRIEDIA